MGKHSRIRNKRTITCTNCNGYGFLEDTEFGLIDDTEPCVICKSEGYITVGVDSNTGYDVYDFNIDDIE